MILDCPLQNSHDELMNSDSTENKTGNNSPPTKLSVKPRSKITKLWRTLDKNQKTGLTVIALAALTLPLGTIAALTEIRTRSQAYLPISSPVSPPSMPTPTPTPSSTPISSVPPTSQPCGQALHMVSMTPSTQSGYPGSTLTYFATITNRATSGCGSSYFNASSQLPVDNWWASFSPPTISLAPGESKTISAGFTSSPTTPYRSEGYPVAIKVAGPMGTVTATSNYQILASNTPIPTFAPTPTPTLTPTPYPTPTPTFLPSPTPTPTFNTAPKFLTFRLPTARANRRYKASITVYDNDKDSISMTIAGLPKGLTFAGCSNPRIFFSRSLETCSIAGTPSAKGSYTVYATIVDGKGGKTIKTYTITVR